MNAEHRGRVAAKFDAVVNIPEPGESWWISFNL
jgi:hypothetical protein